MGTWSDNLRFLRQRLSLSQKELGDKLGVQGSRIRDYELGVSEPNMDLLVRLAQFFQITLNDFITRNLAKAPLNTKEPGYPMQQAPRILVISESPSGTENIVHVPVKAHAGYLNGFEDPDFIESLPAYRLPGVRSGTYRSFEIKGDSMLPLQSGIVVVGKYVESWRDIKSNKTYVLVTRQEGVVYKRIINKVKSKGQLILLSDNPVYEPYSINIEEVIEAWAYYCHLSNAGAQQKNNLEQLLKAVEELKSEVVKLTFK